MNIIVKDKARMDEREVRHQLKEWMKLNYAYLNFEMHYKDIPPRIYAEQLLCPANGGEPEDYKFLCFGGKPYYVWVDKDRYSNHTRNMYDLEWRLQPWRQLYENYPHEISNPKNFPEMVEIAEKLCKGFAHVRVDLYNVNGKIYFGELTFTNGNGLEIIRPKQYNLELGNLWDMDTPVS